MATDIENKVSENVVEAEVSLYQMANGYYTEDIEEIWNTKFDANGNIILDANGEPVLELACRKIKKKFQPKSVSAMKEYLKAEYPDKYATLNKMKVSDRLEQVMEAMANGIVNVFEDEESE